jgi:exopolysaccharide production protein ExoZ
MNTSTDRRIISLDFLRGMAASIVMCGHFYIWSTEPNEPPIQLYKFINYAVSIFYILSGITLYSVYRSSFGFDLKSFKSFAIKRVFRILPLLWVATTLTIVLMELRPSFRILFFNYTGLFGFINERAGIARAAWSIGNEMIFYMFFPLYILSLKLVRTRVIFYLGVFLSILPAIYITFFQMSVNKTPATEFRFYINPLNQLFLFVAGIWIAQHFSSIKVNPNFVRILCVLFLSFFVLYPIEDPIRLFAGVDRLILCFICIVVCACIFKMKSDDLSAIVKKPLSFLGDVSYSIYLLHPIVYLTVNKLISIDSIPQRMVLCIVLTMVLSQIVFKYIETPAMDLAKKFVTPSNQAKMSSEAMTKKTDSTS